MGSHALIPPPRTADGGMTSTDTRREEDEALVAATTGGDAEIALAFEQCDRHLHAKMIRLWISTDEN